MVRARGRVRVRRDSGRRALVRPGEGEALALCVGVAVLLGLVHLHESGEVGQVRSGEVRSGEVR